MSENTIWKILAILFVLLMVISCATPSIAVDNNLTNNASKEQNLNILLIEEYTSWMH